MTRHNNPVTPRHSEAAAEESLLPDTSFRGHRRGIAYDVKEDSSRRLGMTEKISDRWSVVGGRWSVRRIAILRAIFLGDLLCSVPAFRALRRGFPNAEITLIGLPWARDFVARMPFLDTFVEFPGYPGIAEVPVDPARTAAFIAEAQATGYDLLIQMHGSGVTSNGFVAALGARASLGFRNGPDDRLDYSLLYDPDEHELRRWLRLVETLGVPVDDTSTTLPYSEDEEAAARALLGDHDGPTIVLHAGAKEAARRWSPERFAALGDALVEQSGARIVLTGSEGEVDITGEIVAKMRHPVIDLAGRTNLGTFAAVLDHADLVVTNDTGASHVAIATQTPSVVLFGVSHPDQWGPLDPVRHRVLDARHWAPGGDPETILTHLPLPAVLDACYEQLMRWSANVDPAIASALGGVLDLRQREAVSQEPVPVARHAGAEESPHPVISSRSEKSLRRVLKEIPRPASRHPGSE
jgi:ADP-heptose:LPS heptosyltransferase